MNDLPYLTWSDLWRCNMKAMRPLLLSLGCACRVTFANRSPMGAHQFAAVSGFWCFVANDNGSLRWN